MPARNAGVRARCRAVNRGEAAGFR
jgi:hypothetical protein